MIETKKEGPMVYVDNLVGTSDLKTLKDVRIQDLGSLYFALRQLMESGLPEGFKEAACDVEYKPEKFAALIIRLKKPKATVNVFNSGRVICTGCTNKEDMESAIKTVAWLIKLTTEPESLPINGENLLVEISNVVCSTNIGRQVGCGIMQKAFPGTEIKISKFAGGTYKISYHGGTLMIFATGRIMAMGFRDIDTAKNTVLEAIQLIIRALNEYGNENQGEVCKLERFEPTHLRIKEFAVTLDISEEVKVKAIELIRQYCQKVTKETFGGAPESFAAAAIYIAGIFCGQRLTQYQIYDKVGVSEVAIRNAKDKIKNTLGLEIIL